MALNGHPLAQYFSNLWLGIITTWKGLTLTGRYFVSPKVTMEYPEVKPVIPEGHRGIHTYDEDSCSVCLACQAACPVDCIMIDYLSRGKDAMIVSYDIDYSKCLFCNLCCEACKPACVHLGPQYDLSSASKDGCVLHLARVKKAEELAQHKEMLEKKEAEKKAKQEALRKQNEASAATGGQGTSEGEK
jgi:NADH-quinone oxidoreductase subunit I